MPAAPGGDRQAPERSTTFVVFSDQGQGQPVQFTISQRRMRLGVGLAGGAVAVLVLAAVVQVSTLSRVTGHDALVAENLALKTEVTSVRDDLAELAPLIQRVRAYDETLRGLAASGALPGFGPLDAEAMAARESWIAGIVGSTDQGAPPSADALFAELQEIDFAELEENLALLQRAGAAMPQMWPVEGVLTSGFGWRRDPFGRSRWKFHGGLDIGAEYGTPILATGSGIVEFSGWDSGHGRMVEIDHGSDIRTRYCHASTLLVMEGEEVVAGQTVALVGSSGMSTGPHLHYELVIDDERVDPRPYLPDEGP